MQNFFFGPGYEIIKDIFLEMFENLAYKNREYYKTSVLDWDYDWLIKRAGVFIGNIQAKNKLLTALLSPVYTVLWVLHFAEFAAGWVFGALLTVILTGFYLLCVYIPKFIIVMINLGLTAYEKMYLLERECRCPECKLAYREPYYICEVCGSVKEKLTHGVHGIFNAVCNGDRLKSDSEMNSKSVKCRNRLPLSLSRKKYIPRQCTNPQCEKIIENNSVFLRPYLHLSLQMVGGESSGKTEFLEALKTKVEYKNFEHFKTIGNNADSHTAVSDKGVCLTLYDMRGTIFEDWPDYNRAQLQFTYCDGIVFIVDPTSTKSINPEDILANFSQELKNLCRLGENESCKVPIAVVVSKTDLLETEIKPDKVKQYIEEKFPALIHSLDASYKVKKFFSTAVSNKPNEAEEVYEWLFIKNKDKK